VLEEIEPTMELDKKKYQSTRGKAAAIEKLLQPYFYRESKRKD